MLVNVHNAKSQLSKLIVAVKPVGDVVIAGNGRPGVRLVPVPPNAFRFGILEQLVATVPDFDESMGDDELVLWEGDGQ